MAINSAEELIVGLRARGAIGYATVEEVGVPGGFIKLKSGRISPTYVNTRGLTSISKKIPMPLDEQVDLRDLVLQTYSEVIDEEQDEYDHLLGIPHAMTALAAMVGIRRGDSVLSMRTEKKEHGISKMIEGDYSDDETVLELDDVVTDGGSKLETIEKIEAAGLQPGRIIVLVDRQEGGREVLESKGLKISSALGMGAITVVLAEQRLISDRQVQWTGEYFQDLVEDGIIKQIPEDLAAIL